MVCVETKGITVVTAAATESVSSLTIDLRITEDDEDVHLTAAITCPSDEPLRPTDLPVRPRHLVNHVGPAG